MKRGQQYDNQRGLAKVRVKRSKKGKVKGVQVIFKPTRKGAKPIQFTLGTDSVPECVLHSDFPDNEVFYADVNRATEELQNLFPSHNMGSDIVAHCIGFPHKEGEKPTFKTVSTDYGKGEVISQPFYAILEITSPEHLNGLTKGYRLRHDKFIDLGGTLGVAEEMHKQAIHAQLLWEFMKYVGVAGDDLPYKDNNLPQLHKLIVKHDKEFRIYIKTNTSRSEDGTERHFVNIDSLQPLTDSDEDWGADYDDGIEESDDSWEESEDEPMADGEDW